MTTPPSASRPGHSALRRGRVSREGQLYLVTFTTHQRQPLFTDVALAAIAAGAFTDQRVWRNSSLMAWVLMPDHWHGVLELGEGGRLASVINALKTNSARHIRKDIPGKPTVWARGYHDRALRTGESLVDVARYVVMNPVRAGLVRRVGDYPFWDAVWL